MGEGGGRGAPWGRGAQRGGWREEERSPVDRKAFPLGFVSQPPQGNRTGTSPTDSLTRLFLGHRASVTNTLQSRPTQSSEPPGGRGAEGLRAGSCAHTTQQPVRCVVSGASAFRHFTINPNCLRGGLTSIFSRDFLFVAFPARPPGCVPGRRVSDTLAFGFVSAAAPLAGTWGPSQPWAGRGKPRLR